MKDLKLQTGDVFCTGNPQSKFVGAGIKFFEILYSKDNKAEFGHSGIILNSKGTTFEALWKVKSQCIYKDYVGQNVIIARPILDLNGNTLVTRDKRSAILEITNKYNAKFKKDKNFESIKNAFDQPIEIKILKTFSIGFRTHPMIIVKHISNLASGMY